MRSTLMSLAAFVAFQALGLLAPASVSADEVQRSFVASPDVYKVIGENEHYRIIAATWQPGQKDKLHSHGATVASYWLTDCRTRNHLPDGKTSEREIKAGSTSIRNTNLNHAQENIGTTPCKAVIFEPK